MIWTDKHGFLEIIKHKKKYGIFLDMGVGKTSLLLALCDYKIFAEKVKKILIVAPKKVTLSTWQNEIKKWKNFNYMLSILKAIEGTPDKRNNILSETGEYCIHIISSDLLHWLYGKKVKEGKRTVWKRNPYTPKYDMFIIDECSQFKDTTTERFKTLKRFDPEYLFLLSGTPFPNIIRETNGKYTNYLKADELYYVFYLLGIFPKSLTQFRNEFCYTLTWDKYNYRMYESTYDTLMQILDGYSIRKQLKLDVKLNEHKIYCPIDEEHMKTLKNDFYIETDGYETITASSKAIMINKALQLSNGFVYDDFGEVKRLNTYKFDALKNILETYPDRNFIIYYVFKEDKKFLLDNIEGAEELTDKSQEEKWNKGEIKYLILSPFSAKFGLNLQHGGYSIIWYGLVWSGESYNQANARLYRTGQTKDVDVFYILGKNSFDDYVYERLISKTETMDNFLNYLRGEKN